MLWLSFSVRLIVAKSLAAAVQILPALGDGNSPEFKAVAQMVRENPLLRNRADWPIVVTKQYLGAQAFDKLTKPAAATATATATPPPKPTAKAAPGAPRKATASMPAADANAAIRAKLANGTATLAEVQQLARSMVGA